MKLHARILAGTALGVLMASAPGWADQRLHAGSDPAQELLLAQADIQPDDEEDDSPATGNEEAPAGDEPAPAAEQPAAAEDQQPAPSPEAAPDPAPAAEPQAETPAEPAQADDVGPPDEPAMEAPEELPAQPQEPEPEPEIAPEPEQPAQPEPEEPSEAEEPAAGTPAVEPGPAEQTPADEAAPASPAPEAETDQPAVEEPGVEAPEPQQPPVTDGGDPAPSEEPTPTPETGDEAPAPEEQSIAPAPGDQIEGAPENAAPVLDSAKQPVGAEGEQPTDEQAPDGQAVEPVGPPPGSDAEAQSPEVVPEDIEPITATEGRRIDREQFRRERRERPEGAEVLREIGERVIFQLGGEAFVQGNDRRRLERNAEDVYYDELPRGRVRETIVRANGVQIITVYNRFGDVVRRSRVMPDGREVILAYVDERNYDRRREWRDPGRDLPPLRLSIPYREYILDAGRVQDPDRYYQFLDQPPVERVRQLYSVEDVKRSARLRDTVRRVDLDTITFASGSAEVSRSEAAELEGIASAMQRMMDENPAETFLIEGHTDAVGSDISNLALSDARAESVANVLTQYFDIPPENLVTQGYGERYLKIATDGPSRENRRVAIRRITPLVTPVASAQ